MVVCTESVGIAVAVAVGIAVGIAVAVAVQLVRAVFCQDYKERVPDSSDDEVVHSRGPALAFRDC